jgi:hypothetical protein
MSTKISKQKPLNIKMNNHSLEFINKINNSINYIYSAKLVQREKLLEIFKQFNIDFIVNRNTFPNNDFQYLWILYHYWDFIIIRCRHVRYLDDFVKFKSLFDMYISDKNEDNYKVLRTNIFENIKCVYKNYWRIIPNYIKEEVYKVREVEKDKFKTKTYQDYLKEIEEKKKKDDGIDNDESDIVENNIETGLEKTSKTSNSDIDNDNDIDNDIVFMNLSDVDDDASNDVIIPGSIIDNLINVSIYDDEDVDNNNAYDDNRNHSDDEIIFYDVDEK